MVRLMHEHDSRLFSIFKHGMKGIYKALQRALLLRSPRTQIGSSAAMTRLHILRLAKTTPNLRLMKPMFSPVYDFAEAGVSGMSGSSRSASSRLLTS